MVVFSQEHSTIAKRRGVRFHRGRRPDDPSGGVMPNDANHEPDEPRSARPERAPAGRPTFAAVLLAAMLTGLGFLIRLPSLGSPPFEFHPARQYQSAVIARAFFRERRAEIPAWKREAALAAAGQLQLEPPIVEHMASALYLVAGGEKLWLPRLASIVYWLLGSLCVFALSRRLFSEPAALVALAVCLFIPFGIKASRSFQPDPLMVALTCAGWWTLFRYTERPLGGRLFWAVLASASAVFVKPMALFFLIPAGLFLAFRQGGWRGIFKARWLRVWIGLVVLPAVGYYLFQYFGGPFRSQHEGRLIVGLWAAPAYWRGWFRMLSRVIGVGLLGAGAVGVFVVRSRPASTLLRGLWCGYAAYGLVFNYHIHTHDYYSLPFIPVVALTLGGLVQAAFDRFPPLAARRSRPAALGLLLVGIGFGVWRGFPGAAGDASKNTALAYERLGEILGHSRTVIVLDSNYGLPVFYHGDLAGAVWPVSFDFKKNGLMGLKQDVSAASPQARVAGADYFVATNIGELNAQSALAEDLKIHFPRIPFDDPPAPGVPSILIYDLRRSRLEPERAVLTFGALTDGTCVTAPQAFRLVGGAGISWRAMSSNPAFTVSPESGTGSVLLTVSVCRPPSQKTFGDAGGTITIVRADGVAVPPVRLSLDARAPGDSGEPFGSLDVPPADVSAASGPVFFSGWALDDLEVKRILLLREPVGRESRDGPLVISEIPLVAGTRPDVEKAHGDFPRNDRAGWGILVRPESLPLEGGPWTFHVDVEDIEGHRIRLGTRVVAWKD